MDPWASFASGALYSAFQLGIILGFAERKKLLKRNLCVESVVSHTFENGKLSAGITPDRCGQLRFSVDDDCTITVPFHYRNTKSATDRGLVRYDGGAIIRIGELAALPMLSLHTVYGDDKEKRPPKPLHLVRIKTFTYKWGRVNGIPFVVEGTTEVVRGRARLLCRSKYLINKEWEPWAEDALWLMHDDAILHITDTSGRGFIMWYDYHQGLQCAELL
ncbi:MAG TPA: hypothetical protein VJB93_04405 [Patescibacteria group bacterium]|nr:hypothetical protein [Patescibacteria group bacterium]